MSVRSIMALFVLLLGGLDSLQAQERQMVLVAKKQDVALHDNEALMLKEVRLLYMGRYHSPKGKPRLDPLLNTQDALLHEVFLQKILFMSDRYYRRYLLKRAFRSGRPQARSLEDAESWPVSQYTVAVSYMWKKDVDLDNFQIVMNLWQGEIH